MMSIALNYGQLFAEKDEERLNNYHARVAFGFFILAFLGYLSLHLGGIPEETGFIWVGMSLIAFPTVRFLEDAMSSRSPGNGKEEKQQEQTPLRQEQEFAGEEEGTMEHYVSNSSPGAIQLLSGISTPDCAFDDLLLTEEGAVIAIQRSRLPVPVGLSESGELVDAQGEHVETKEIEDFKLAVDRVRHVIHPIPGPEAKVSGIYLVPDGSFDHSTLSDEAFHLVPESSFEYAVSELCRGSELNTIIWDNVHYLRSMIKG